MSNLYNIKQDLISIEVLERELNLKQLQVNRLLNITQAINNNVSARGLYDMYRSFLSWEIGVRKMALFVKGEDCWSIATHIGIDESLLDLDITAELSRYTRLNNIQDEDHPLIGQFDVVIPVRHKDHPIAYVLIGGFEENEDMYNKVQFITTITNIVAVAIENKRLFKRQLEQERLKREMELASEMQRMLIPKSLPSKECYELSSIYKPHFNVGGDYFDFIEFADGKIVFCVGDISGKGVAAALLMANFQANFHTLINKRTRLDIFIRDINTSINRITEGDRFMTFFIAEYDINDRSLFYINAGHNPPIMMDQRGITFLDRGCTILGSFQDLPEVEVGAVEVQDEAIILTFTDGLTDIRNEAGSFIKEEILHDFVSEHYLLPAKVFNEKLLGLIDQFRGKQAYPDDFTILSCRIFNN